MIQTPLVKLVLSLSLLASVVNAHLIPPPEPSSTTLPGDKTNLASTTKVKVNAVADASLPASTAKVTLRAQQSQFNTFTLDDVLPSRPATSTIQLPDVPQVCQNYNVDSSQSPAECPVGNTMSATSVTFGDCGSSYTICRCENSTAMSMDDAIKTLGAVPIGLRRYMGTIMLMPDSEPHAYTLTTGDIHIFADCELPAWVHEATHALDYANPNSPLSSSTAALSARSLTKRSHPRDFRPRQTTTTTDFSGGWLPAIQADTCVPDTYSQTNAIEDFAQIGVLKIYALTHNGTLPAGFDATCMQNQLAFIDSLPQFDANVMFGNTCDYDTTGERGGVQTGGGVKHDQPPSPLNPSFISPYNNSKTVSGPGSSSGGVSNVAAADNSSSKQNSSASLSAKPTSLAFSIGTMGMVMLLALV